MKVQVRHLLVRSSAGGVPHAQSVGRKHFVDGPRDARDRHQDRSRGGIVSGSNIWHVRARNHEHVTRMKLAKVHERQRERI